METFGERLRRIREEKGWSRKTLAVEAGLEADNIEKYERGLREPRLFTAACLADTLGVSLDDLAGFWKEDCNE